MPDYLPISALQHYAYCPRQFALVHVERAWEENRFTAEGRVLHERVDSGVAEQRGSVRHERGVQLVCERYRIQGKMDLLEIHAGEPPVYYPVEYKRGKPKPEDWDRIQLCAQALCIEEMKDTAVNEGALWYWQPRRREVVALDDGLRKATIAAIRDAGDLLARGCTPPPINNKKLCRACSLLELCQPDAFRRDWSARYVAQLVE